MMKVRVLAVWLFFVVSIEGRGLNRYRRIRSGPIRGISGNPLFLTPYIESGRAEDGRLASEVPPLLDDIKSFSGYLTVNKSYDTNLFLWYFPAENKPESAPVVLWLQGGPGESCMFGVFTEMGPFAINSNLTVRKREHYWSKDVHMIFIDSPAGTGFSFTKNPAGYVTNQEEVARDLYSAMIQFYQLFPELQPHEFFLAGESYGGKYVPAFAYNIHVENQSVPKKINLKGMAIGNGFVDPVNMMKYGDYLVQHGLIDDETLLQFHRLEAKIVDAVGDERYLEASKEVDVLFSLIDTSTGDVDIYNYMKDGAPELDPTVLSKYLSLGRIRKKLHVGTLPWNDATKVEKYLKADIMKSVKPWFEVLLEHYKILLYSGQLDICVAYPLSVNFIKKLEWSGSSDYLAAKRKKWVVDENLAGYSKSVKNFTELLVRNAGHMVPLDRPKQALEMIKTFMLGSTF